MNRLLIELFGCVEGNKFDLVGFVELVVGGVLVGVVEFILVKSDLVGVVVDVVFGFVLKRLLLLVVGVVVDCVFFVVGVVVCC